YLLGDVGLGLTVATPPHPGHREAACFQNLLAAVLAVVQARALRNSTPSALNLALDAGVDLVLYGSIRSPTTGHAFLLSRRGYLGTGGRELKLFIRAAWELKSVDADRDRRLRLAAHPAPRRG